MIHHTLNKFPWWVQALFVAGLTILGTLYTNHITASLDGQSEIIKRISTVEDRSTKLEAHQADDHEILVHIQAQVDRITEWALGKK